jgi:hypothetical protein
MIIAEAPLWEACSATVRSGVWDRERGSVVKHEGRQGGGCTYVFRGRRCPLPQRAEQLARTAGQQGQTRRPDQVVVADGRSTDGTREWLEQFQRDRPAGRGQPSTARLRSPELCRRGRRRGCCGPVDAQSTYAPSYIQMVVRVFDERPEVVAVGGAP